MSLDTLCDGTAPAGVYAVAADTWRRHGTELADAGLGVHVVDAAGATDKSSLLAAVGRGLGAPGWWGANWDALVDLLRDPPGVDDHPAGLVVVVLDPGGVALHDPVTWATFVDIARGACRWWSGQGRPFHVLVVDTDPLSGLAAL